MKPGTFDGVTRTLGEAQGYVPLPIRDETIECAVGGPDTPAMVSAWTLDEQERARIAAGAPICLSIVGTAHPPVMLWVGEPLEADQ